MRRKILIKTGSELRDSLLDVVVERRDDSRYILARHGLIVAIEVRPYRRARSGFAQFQFKCDATHQIGRRDLAEIVQVPSEDIVATNIAAPSVDALKAIRGAEFSKQYIANHFRGRLCPTLVLVDAHVLSVVCIHNMVLAIEMRGGYGGEHKGHVIRTRSIGRRCVARDGQLIELAGPSGPAPSAKTDAQQQKRAEKGCGLHRFSPGLCSGGFVERIREDGRFLMVAVNSFRFSVA